MVVRSSSESSAVKLTVSPDGNTVFAVIDKARATASPVLTEHILMALDEMNATDYEINYASIDRLIKSQGAGGQPLPVAMKVDGSVDVEIAQNKMSAFMTLRAPKGGRNLETEDVIAALAANGVKFGLKQEVIENAVAQQWYNEKVLVAEGKEPVNGEDGRVEILFNAEGASSKPTILEDGSVDFHQLNLIINVKADEPLAEKFPPSEGEHGMTVMGQELPARPGRDVPFPIGKNVTFSKENPNIVVAQVAGMPHMISGKIHVYPVYEISGNVDFSTGNIQFVGDVIIRGGVLEGFVVKCDANLTVYGPVAGAVLEAGGNVFLNKGMHGQDKGSITAGEDVVAKFLEHCTVRAGGNIKTTDGVIQCNVNAKKNVICEGKKGVIIGGRVSAGEEVKAKVIGNYMATPTEIEAGGSPKVREELRQIEEQKKALRLNLDRTEKGVKSLKMIQERQGALPPDKKDLLLQLTRAQYHLMGQLKKLESREEELEEILASSFKGKVVISEAIYPGVKLIIKQAVLHIRDQVGATTFYEQDGEIHVGAF